MLSWLEPINLFPYTHLWRVKREPQHHNKCAIVTSIILIAAIGALFFQRLIVVFNKNEMTATSQTVVTQTPPITTLSTHISTYKTNPKGHQPFMIALDWYAGNPSYSDIEAYPPDAIAWKSTLSGPYVRSRLGHNDTIQFQPCTPEHFSIFPNIESQFLKWEAQRWVCLPINQTYTIQGNYGFDNVFSRICLMLNCSGSCMDHFHDYNFRIYTLSSLVNPTNGTEPVKFFLEETVMPISRQVHQQYAFDMTQNYIDTDLSIYPWQQTKTQSSISLDAYRFIQRNVTANESSTFIYFHRSYKTIEYKAKFLQLVDAISFVGGIFQVMIGIFAFMLIFGRIFFELKFARIYFKADDYFDAQKTKDFGFRKLIKQQIYKLLKSINRAPKQWESEQRRYQYQETVNQLLDITYLQRRIDTLERAMSIILTEPQMKGLYLAQPKNIKGTQETYKKHQLRDQVINYLHFKHQRQKKQEEQGRGNKKKYIQPSIERRDSSPRMRMRPRNSIEERQNRMEAELPEPPGRVNRLGSQQYLVPSSYEDLLLYEQNKEEYEFQLEGANSLLVNEDFKPITQRQFKYQIAPDLRKFFKEVQDPAGDPISQKIYGKIDIWLRQLLRKQSQHEELLAKKKKSMEELEGSQKEYIK